MMDVEAKPKKSVEWMGDSKRRLGSFPWNAKQTLTYGIYLAETWRRHPDAKPLKGLGVIEIPCDDGGDTFRAVYTIELDDWVYVLHCFQKKSKQGIRTPRPDIDLIRQRLKEARKLHATENRNKARKK